MELQNAFQIHQTALDLAQLKSHTKIVELLFHNNQNWHTTPTFRENLGKIISKHGFASTGILINKNYLPQDKYYPFLNKENLIYHQIVAFTVFISFFRIVTTDTYA